RTWSACREKARRLSGRRGGLLDVVIGGGATERVEAVQQAGRAAVGGLVVVIREFGVDAAQDVERATDVAAHGSLDCRIGVGFARLAGQARHAALGRAEEVVGRDGAAELRGDLGDLGRGVGVVAVVVTVVLAGVAVVALTGVAVVVLGRLDLDALGRVGVD